MKTHKLKVTLNEIKRMQQLAGILKEEENPYDALFDDDDDTPKSNNTSSKYKNVPSLEELKEKMKRLNGNLDLRKTDIEALPQGLKKVDGSLYLDGCKSLKELPKGLEVDGHLLLNKTNIKELPQGLKVGKSLSLNDCTSLKELPQDLKVDGDLYLDGCTSLEELPQGLKVNRSLILNDCTSLKELPQGFKVKSNLKLNGCTSLKELPQGLEVDGLLGLVNTPIAQKYSEREIRNMIENGGGYVKGKIYI